MFSCSLTKSLTTEVDHVVHFCGHEVDDEASSPQHNKAVRNDAHAHDVVVKSRQQRGRHGAAQLKCRFDRRAVFVQEFTLKRKELELTPIIVQCSIFGNAANRHRKFTSGTGGSAGSSPKGRITSISSAWLL